MQPVPTLDLREFCRDADTTETLVTLHWTPGREFEWLRLGQIRIVNRTSGSQDYDLWTFDSYMGEHTDREHDSAFVLSMDLIGVKFQRIMYCQTLVTAWIAPDQHQFSVPGQDTDRFKDAEPCMECKGQSEEHRPHLLVDYLPPDNRELYKLVSGKRVTIRTGVRRKEE